MKYWGKHGVQLPANASVSFTLSECHTDTLLTAVPRSNGQMVKVWVDGREESSFLPKIDAFLKHVMPVLPELKDFSFEVRTHNTFPHSSGIASSASGMSALALCMYDIASQVTGKEMNLEKVSELARLGSGSASRSVYGPVSVWGDHDDYDGSSDRYAIPFKGHDKIFSTYLDTILIVDRGEKKVSSSVGHGLITHHPFANARYEVARKNMKVMKRVLAEGDLETFVKIVEDEALMLHALMMTSDPSFILMKPYTLKIIEMVREYRKTNRSFLCFTLDAGANVHLLYPEAEKASVGDFIENELKQYCADGYYICDQVGGGPFKID